MSGDGPFTTDAGPFPETRESIFDLARRPGSAEYREAWERLFRAYAGPLYGFLRRHGCPREEARDLVQDFFVEGLYKPKLERYDPSRGRLRTYLVKCLVHRRRDVERLNRLQLYRDIAHVLAREDEEDVEARIADEVSMSPEEALDREWAERTLEEAVGAVQERLLRIGDDVGFRVLREWVLPGEDARRSAADLAADLGVSVGALMQHGTRLRASIREAAAEAIRLRTPGAAEAGRELEELWAILSAARP